MDDDDFKPRLGRMRAASSPRGRKYLSGVLAAAAAAGIARTARARRFDGSRIARGSALGRLLASRDRHAGLRGRRAIVKTRLVRLGRNGGPAARAHLRYIQRDGVTREGDPGRLYSAGEEAADGKAFLERCEGDRHQFRFIVSAEDGAQYDDLKPLIRRLMRQLEQDLGTGLDWVAADHVDTAHPHTHIILRGKDDRGHNLVIAPDYIARGMRERVAELVSLDLGPRTDLEIERRLTLDMDAERLTATDRALLRDSDHERVVAAGGRDMRDHAVRTGRLRKLEALGLAEHVGAGRWRLDPELETTLRRLGERGDIIRTMQRELSQAKLTRGAAEQRIFDPQREDGIVGLVIARGLADELRDRHYLIVDAVDGRSHYVDIGRGDATEPIASGAIVRIESRKPMIRDSDRRIVEVAAASNGRYSTSLHVVHDPTAGQGFVQAHVRRLEAIRRRVGGVERGADGSWTIPPSFSELAARYESQLVRDKPVEVETLSPIPLQRLPAAEGATWLDRELSAANPEPLRDAGFGREARSALALRRAWLIGQELATEGADGFALRSGALATLQRRDLARQVALIAHETGLDYAAPTQGMRVDGIVRRRVDLASGRFALITSEREFSLVPWRPVLARAIDRQVSGIVRGETISWTIGRGRGLDR